MVQTVARSVEGRTAGVRRAGTWQKIQSPWSNAGGSKELRSTNRRPMWRATVPYRARLLATVPYRARFAWARCAWMCPASRRQCAFVVRTVGVEDSPLSIQRSRKRGRGEASKRRARRVSFQQRWQPPWLASAQAHCKRTRVWAVKLTFCFEYPFPRDAGGFNEPNKTVVK